MSSSVISVHVGTRLTRKIVVPISVALVVSAMVRTGARIVETVFGFEVVISADIRASAGRHAARIVSKAGAVSVVPSSRASRLFVVAVTVAE